MLGAILGAAGSALSGFLGKSAADKQADLQKTFAKNAIQWKVKDAQKAGIHPLYALGANTVSYSPVSVGQPDLGAMGQDIGSAIDRVSAPTDKVGGQLGALALERAGLENDLLRAQIARARINVAGQVAGPEMAGINTPIGNIPIPANVGSAQDAENWFGEAGGELVGMLNLDRALTDTAFKPDSPLIYVKKVPAKKPTIGVRGPYRY